MSKIDCYTGTLACNPDGHFGFLICDDTEIDDIFIAGKNMAGALDGDTVKVRVLHKKTAGAHREGLIVNIYERANSSIVGVIFDEKDGFAYVRPDNRKLYTKIFIPLNKKGGARIGERVCVSELEYTEDRKVYGRVSAILGDANELSGITEGIIADNNIKQEFSVKTLREADKIPQTVTERMLRGREDIRDKLIFTIDGDDAKDFDDAVSLDILDNGNYLLGVHIADVAEYVTEGSALDSEAFDRGTSVYLADRVIPMLPESLSNGICSLNPNVDRLTLSCFMEIDKNGDIARHRLAETVIRSKERMTYNNVNKLFDGADTELTERYINLMPTLNKMREIADILHKKRIRRGAIMFDFPECHIIMGKDGEPVDIMQARRGISNNMIEEFMLAANETVAEYASLSELPFIYRSHEPPTDEKITSFNQIILKFGLQITGKFDENHPITPRAMQEVLDKAKNSVAERVVSSEMLRSLMKAKYTVKNLGHFGLAAKYYCHFTSPIRRYPDLCVHRILKKTMNREGVGNFRTFTEAAASHSTDKEIAAETAEREVDNLMKAAYMSRFVGKDFDGIISGISSYGMYIELENTVEGLVRLENITDDFYELDESANVIIGRKSKKIYKIGDSMKVVLARSDILSRQIDFVPESCAGETLRKFLPKKQYPSVAEKTVRHRRKSKHLKKRKGKVKK